MLADGIPGRRSVCSCATCLWVRLDNGQASRPVRLLGISPEKVAIVGRDGLGGARGGRGGAIGSGAGPFGRGLCGGCRGSHGDVCVAQKKDVESEGQERSQTRGHRLFNRGSINNFRAICRWRSSRGHSICGAKPVTGQSETMAFLLSPTKRGIVPEHWRVACQTGTTNVVSSIWDVLIFSRKSTCGPWDYWKWWYRQMGPTNLFRPNSKASISRTKPVHPRASITCLDQTWLPFFGRRYLPMFFKMSHSVTRC